MKEIIGIAMLVLFFCGLIIAMVKAIGWRGVTFVVGGTIFITGWILLAVYLITGSLQ